MLKSVDPAALTQLNLPGGSVSPAYPHGDSPEIRPPEIRLAPRPARHLARPGGGAICPKGCPEGVPKGCGEGAKGCQPTSRDDACSPHDQRGVARSPHPLESCDTGALERTTGRVRTPIFADGYEQGDEEA